MPLPTRRQTARRFGLPLAAAILAALSAGAGSAAAEPAIPMERARPAAAPEPLCFCWNDGRKIPEGLSSCIRTNQGRRLALCGRVLNMMSWQPTGDDCPES
jgi:hypothetical protein